MATKVHGLSVSFGVGSEVFGVYGLYQSRDHHYIANSETVHDGGETSVSKLYWDYREELVLTYVAYQPVNNFPNALVTTPQIGTFVRLADPNYPQDSTDGGVNYAINAVRGMWLVDDIACSNSNTSAVRVTLKLSRYPQVRNI